MRQLLVSLAALLVLPLAAALASPQDEPPTKDDTAKAYIAEVKKEAGKQEEAAAKEVATKLLEIWKDAEVSEDAKKDLPGVMERIAESKDDAAAKVGIEGLEELGGDDAAKALMGLLQKELKAKEPSVEKYSACLKGLGTIASEDAKIVKELMKLLNYKEPDVIFKTARALAGYKDRPGKLRKELLEQCIKSSEGVYAGAQGSDQNAKRKWNNIESGIMAALNALSGQTFANPQEARAWFNDHKKDRDLWD